SGGAGSPPFRLLRRAAPPVPAGVFPGPGLRVPKLDRNGRFRRSGSTACTCRRRGRGGGVVAAGSPRGPGRPRRRGRGPRRRRLAGGLGQPVLLVGLPGPPLPAGHRRRTRVGT